MDEMCQLIFFQQNKNKREKMKSATKSTNLKDYSQTNDHNNTTTHLSSFRVVNLLAVHAEDALLLATEFILNIEK